MSPKPPNPPEKKPPESSAIPQITPLPGRSDSCLLQIKAVPGSSRTTIAGPLGDRLKIRVAAPPEGGQANAAIVALLAETLGLPSRQITITAGQTRPEKTVTITGRNASDAAKLLGLTP